MITSRCFVVAMLLFGQALAAEPAAPAGDSDWRAHLAATDPKFTQMPFWFWNDDLNDLEIRRQMADFRAHGIYGFIIHARIGLPRTLPYMGERWMGHVRTAVTEAARTGMRICLYDEGMYPSGSAHGRVVQSNPAFAAQGLAVTHQRVSGPGPIDIPDHQGTLVACCIARVEGKDRLNPESLQMLEPAARWELPYGNWQVMVFTAVPSDGHIRGVHEDEDDHGPNAPKAADLLNPDAMRAFLEFAYQPYYQAFKDHFGSTIIAMFTDEPNMLGRGARKGLQPWTNGLPEFFQEQRGYDLVPLLPALFFDIGERTQTIRDDFNLTLAERLEQTYYRPLSMWCESHGIALTGHPALSDEIRPLRFFHIPGQDAVWRYVVPNSPKALEGPNSTMGKCSSSVARHDNRRRNSNEVFGAYGWSLTMDEMKWLADWMMVRGVNLFYPHAFYYSIRGNRVHERPPDLGIHNAWWREYRWFADYTARLCKLLTDSEQVCDVAILSVHNHLPWRAAKWLYQHQIDFNYLEDWRLVEQATIQDGSLAIADMRYTTLIVDQDGPLVGPVAARVMTFQKAGGQVRYCRSQPDDALTDGLNRDVVVAAPANDLRCMHLRKGRLEFYLFVNEGEQEISTHVIVRDIGEATWFDAWTNVFLPCASQPLESDRMCCPLQLPRRGSLVLCIDPHKPPAMVSNNEVPLPTVFQQTLSGPWRVLNHNDEIVGDHLALWDAEPQPGEDVRSLRYQTTFHVHTGQASRCELQLTGVGDWAIVHLNGKHLEPRFWSPFVWDVTDTIRAGSNELAIEVFPSLANRYEPSKRRPFGLAGPVAFRSYSR